MPPPQQQHATVSCWLTQLGKGFAASLRNPTLLQAFGCTVMHVLLCSARSTLTPHYHQCVYLVHARRLCHQLSTAQHGRISLAASQRLTCSLLCSSAGLLPGYHATAVANTSQVLAASKCPQGFICEGNAGSPNPAAAISFAAASQETGLVPVPSPAALAAAAVRQCRGGMWTQHIGASSEGDCLVPPGAMCCMHPVVEADALSLWWRQTQDLAFEHTRKYEQQIAATKLYSLGHCLWLACLGNASGADAMIAVLAMHHPQARQALRTITQAIAASPFPGCSPRRPHAGRIRPAGALPQWHLQRCMEAAR
jgi:hypothetical protein